MLTGIELKTGTRFKLADGTTLRVYETICGECENCYFFKDAVYHCAIFNSFKCFKGTRSDHRNVIYIEEKEE